MLEIVLSIIKQCQACPPQLIFLAIELIVALAVRLSRILDPVLLRSHNSHCYSKCLGCKYSLFVSRRNTDLCDRR